MDRRDQILVRGIVQGVGFRPFVFLKAKERALKGQVLNNSAGVLIDVEGESDAIEALIADLKRNPPPRSQIESIACFTDLPAANFADFRIVSSSVESQKLLPIAADLATCDLCLRELFDPSDRRYRYPFINCTQCGPRFTIIEDVPYDRARTTMRRFQMCGDCAAEYTDPSNRRFHAEPIACPVCGPEMVLQTGRDGSATARGDTAIDDAIRWLTDGQIIAIKGIGGYHLACDALNSHAVARLRTRKHREEKPFALMAGSLESIRQYCRISDDEAKLLGSARRPIVLLEKNSECPMPQAVAPGVNTLGFMLPYTPLHHLLFETFGRPLVMTSGNLSEEPIAYQDDDAIERLGKIADGFLLHDRNIHMRTDDSVVRMSGDRQTMLRRSRGYAPEPIKTKIVFHKEILACGAQLKNTFCFGRRRHAFLSQHVGDLENYETYRSLTESVDHFKQLFGFEPEVIAHDLHPFYLSTRYALESNIRDKIGVQHHHAHIASCMVEHGLEGPVIGVAFDGLGYGEDGAIWGGEFLVARFADYRRYAHLRYVPLSGGDTAIRQPWRSALSYVQDALGEKVDSGLFHWWQPAAEMEFAAVDKMARNSVNTVRTSSCGRLFDAVASLLGLRHKVCYEAQAAIELETIAEPEIEQVYPFEIDSGRKPWEIDFRPMIQRIVAAREADEPIGIVSASFHNTIVQAIVQVCRRIREIEKVNQICLGGGTFQNQYLLKRTVVMLKAAGFAVSYPCKVPANDGGIALGQAAIASARLAGG